MCTNGARTGTTRITTADRRSEIPRARIKVCGAPPAAARGGTPTRCAVSRYAASSIRPSAITITGSAWHEACESRPLIQEVSYSHRFHVHYHAPDAGKEPHEMR